MYLRRISLGAVIALALAACAEPPTAPARQAAPTPRATGSYPRTPMHRFFAASTNDHMYSVYAYAGAPTYTREYYEYFFLESSYTSGHIPLFICFSSPTSTSSDNWLSTDSDCEDRDVYRVEAMSGWMSTTELPGTVPLYSQYNALLDDTFHTISLSEALYAEANYNYSAPVLMGYVYTSE